MELVDTDVLIDIQRGHPPALAWFASLSDLPAVPGYVVMELIQDARNKREVRQALRLAAPLAVVWPTEADCARALSDFTAYHLSHADRRHDEENDRAEALSDFTAYHLSHGLGLLDALIAATAIGRSATLYTFNVKHYRIVPGLNVAQPYTR